ncbi:MAG TPA: hybrid sensor histidine kinase/response regulator [Pirellulales bacterium]|nr:hybrid sensor histidine kinase/response regulator [Pirellulales bacterium]
MSSAIVDHEQRILHVPPTRRDGEVTVALLATAGLHCTRCRDLDELSVEVAAGAGAVLLTEESLTAPGIGQLLRVIHEQPSWSQLPVVLLMRGGAHSESAAGVLRALGNVTLLERPAPSRSVVSALEAALRGRLRQYQIRDQLEQIRRAEMHARELQEETQRASQMKDEFLATLSHELRTPLTAIYGWTQMLTLREVDQETLKQGIAIIDRNVRAQTQLIDDLLDMSRIVSGKLLLDMRPVNLLEILRASLDTVAPAIEGKKLRLEVSFSDPVVVNGDASRLQQVFWNLLVNAVKFTPEGGVIRVFTREVGGLVEVSVNDTGQGIDPEFLPRLFDRFTQADASTKRQHGGLGIGLSIVKSLITMHGGAVRALSPGQGRGATFLVQLPVHAAARERGGLATSDDVASPDDGDGIDLSGVRVLVVDDECDTRDWLQRVFLNCGATPALASSSAEARMLVNSFQPDVIISDIGMPEEDGYDFIRAVRSAGCRTPAIALTAFARAEDRQRCLQSGYQSHLRKPVKLNELMAVVGDLAGGSSRNTIANPLSARRGALKQPSR